MTVDVERAREILADLRRDKGWDLSGYEDFFVALGAEEILPRFGVDLKDGHMAVRLNAGEPWFVLGNIRSVHHSVQYDSIDFSTFSGALQSIPSLQRSEEIVVEIALQDSGTRIVSALTNSRNSIDVAIAMRGAVLECSAFVMEHGCEFSHSGATLTMTLQATGPVKSTAA